MGYFSNSTEGELYEAKHCNRCIHQRKGDGERDCAVWEAHLLYQDDEGQDILDFLIPQGDGNENLECTMFGEQAGTSLNVQ